MRVTQVARRYARALYELAKAKNNQQKVFAELRVLTEQVFSEPSIADFINSPLISPDNKMGAIRGLAGKGISEELYNLLLLLAEKNRLPIFKDIATAYEEYSDRDHGVTRGTVKSAAPLNADARKRIEDIVNQVTKKKVIFKYEEDKHLIGGLVAQVGGWTFDDSLDSHLRRMNEELKRRAN